MIVRGDENIWAIVLVGHADGRVTISHIQAPTALAARVREALTPLVKLAPSAAP